MAATEPEPLQLRPLARVEVDVVVDWAAAAVRHALAEVAAFDRLRFGVERVAFLRRWISPPGGLGLGLVEHGRLCGIGVARPCREGFKLGPLFAEDERCAERIFCGLSRGLSAAG